MKCPLTTHHSRLTFLVLAADGPIAVGNSPQEFAAHIKSEQAKWSKVIREANVRIE